MSNDPSYDVVLETPVTRCSSRKAPTHIFQPLWSMIAAQGDGQADRGVHEMSYPHDFVAAGPSVGLEDCAEFRPTAEDEALRCCRVIARDIQSGRILCGGAADFVAKTPSYPQGYVALCSYHTPERVKDVCRSLAR